MKITILLLTVFAFAMMNATGQNTGLNTATPQAYLDINGDLALRMGVINLSNAANADVNTTTNRKSVYRITNSSPLGATISGLTGGVDGRTITLINTSTSQISLENSITTSPSAAANQILTNDGGSLYIPANGAVTLIYDATASRWRVSSFGKPMPVVPDPLWYMDDSSNVYNLNNGKVGIGKTNPTEKLDVNGNMNLGGQLKINGNAGLANQVLMKDAGNNIIWADLSSYKNFVIFDCNNVANGLNANNCANSWTVPAGVTTIVVECWGGGGGGSNITGGAGGGYIMGKFTSTAGSSATISVGAGGAKGIQNGNGTVVNGVTGGTTSFAISTDNITALGGMGASEFSNASINIYLAEGGSFSSSISQYVGYNGNPGNYQKSGPGGETYYADGGDAAMMPNSGGKGAFKNASYYLPGSRNGGILPGGGGGSSPGSLSIDPDTGYSGRGGRIIIHY